MEYNFHKSVTIPGQTLPLRELLHRFTNGVPISDNLERQGTYDFSEPFSVSHMPTDVDFAIGHDANEIDITIAYQKADRGKRFIMSNKEKNPNQSISDKVDDKDSNLVNTAPENNAGE